MRTRSQKRTKPDVRPVVAIGGEVGESSVTFYAYRDEWGGSYVPEEDRTPVSWSDQQLAENTERVRRSGPAARAYENDRRAGLSQPGKIEIRDRLGNMPRRRQVADPSTGGHQLRNPVPRWKRRAEARAADKAVR